jgi:hypothetical protein
MALKKVTFSLTDGALQVLAEHTTPRKRGDFVSSLLVEWDTRPGAVDSTNIYSRFDAQDEALHRIEGKIDSQE